MSAFEEKRDQYIKDNALDVTLGLHYVFEAAENRIAELEADAQREHDCVEHWSLRAEQAEAGLANMRSERVMTKKQLHLTAYKLDKAEAELQRWKDMANAQAADSNEACDELRDELAALKARCCDNCAWTTCWIWALTDLSPSWRGAEEGIMCRLWAERDKP